MRDYSADTSPHQIERRHLVIIKGNQRFVIGYELGSEAHVIKELTRMANDPKLTFDAFDAAVLAYQLGLRSRV